MAVGTVLSALVALSLLARCAVGAAAHDAPVVLSIAGSDSGGGAGIQADLKTCEALGAFGTTAIVALTAQNTRGVQGAKAVDVDLVRAQMDSVLSDMGAHAIKTGMLPTAEIIEAVAAGLDAHGVAVRVVDPVFVAASGDVLVSPDALASLKTRLIPTATVLTPNMPEAGKLLGKPAPTTIEEMREAAAELLSLGARAVLLKGGRLERGDMVDVYADREGAADAGGAVRLVELRYERIETPNTHGAGCTLAAAIAAELAKQAHGHAGPIDALAAVRSAREYLRRTFEASASLRVGTGARGPLNHAGSPWAEAVAAAAASSSSSTSSISSTLWSDSEVASLARASLTNGFVDALSRGSLPKASFAGYVAQDKFFLEAFAQAYTLALAALPSDDVKGAQSFASLVKGVVDELKLHSSYAEKWGVDMSQIAPVPECLAYVDFLADIARRGDVGACAAAMVPCMRLYAYLGQTLKAQQQEGGDGAGAYQEWVDTYADPGFEELAATLEALLDRYAAGGTAERLAELRGLYVRAMELERDFFDAWNPSKTKGGGGGGKEEV